MIAELTLVTSRNRDKWMSSLIEKKWTSKELTSEELTSDNLACENFRNKQWAGIWQKGPNEDSYQSESFV